LLFLEARVATKKTSPKLTKIVTESIHDSTVFHSLHVLCVYAPRILPAPHTITLNRPAGASAQ
jgi:hypothetical protein